MPSNQNYDSPAPEERKLGAIMFADMTGFTLMMQEDESRARLMRNRQRSVLENLIPHHHGKIIQYFGDGTLALFNSATDAVRCGIGIQQELKKAPVVKLRIGIHSGDIVYDKDGIYGDSVNVASRIESISVPGAVLFSAKVFDEIKNQPDIKACAIGKFRFKNVNLPVLVYAASNEGLVIPALSEISGKTEPRFSRFSFFRKKTGKLITLVVFAGIITASIILKPFAAAMGKLDSIAVLPLDNLSADSTQEYFASGIHETLINELSKISSLRVISRTSMMQYKDSRKSATEIAKELDVKVLLEGSVVREGNQVRITVQLIDGNTDRHLWAKEFNREIQGILALYSEVAKKIADEIKIKLTEQDEVRLITSQAIDPVAYEYYLLGRHYWNQRTLQSYKQAIEYYKLAIKKDSNYAAAYGALGETYMISGEQGGISQQQARILSDSAIQKALFLDKNLAEAHASRSFWMLSYQGNWVEAEKSIKKAIELNPGYAGAYQTYGRILSFMERYDEALTQLEKARELNPLSPIVLAYIGQVKIFSKHFVEAEKELRNALKLHPEHPLILHNLGELYLASGQYQQAIEPLKQSAESAASVHYKAILAQAYAKANNPARALEILTELNNMDAAQLSPFNLAFVYLSLGNKNRALELLEKGYVQQDVWMKEIKVWPWFDELKNEKRYQELIQKMNFPE